MRVLFAGSADVSAQLLEALYLAPGINLVGVITQPNRPAGRNRHDTACPCKQRAEALKLGAIISTPEKINSPDSLEHIASLKPDILVVVAYGQFLGSKLLNLPPLGCINIHLSLLPLLRGAAPVQWAIANGHSRTGVTAMHMNEGMDSGDILDTIETRIEPEETTETLYRRLIEMSASLLLRVLPAVGLGIARRTPQDHTAATFAPKLKKDMSHVDFTTQTAVEIERRVRAFNPWPGCLTLCPDPSGHLKILKILHVKIIPGASGYNPGQVCALNAEGPVIQCREDALLLLSVIPEARAKISGKVFLANHPHLALGDPFPALEK